jgi:hypothetical protein
MSIRQFPARPVDPAEPFALAGSTDAVPSSVKPAPIAPDEMSQVVEEGRSPVAPPHSSHRLFHELGRLEGYREACADVFAVMDDPDERAKVIDLLAEKATALLQKLIGDVRVSAVRS